ncbi:TorF family putative porin [Phenylobacterium sp.]|uniref:TorF family putative porin n=1 Tax=Phenylobacterium sp. TaxID=1871053 RepID=UPI002736C23D|nr:TorF family putative porin [Phenylobacterium sp.]MDP3855123.1 TorF family putative porin [Phenylobacterium sp.]
MVRIFAALSALAALALPQPTTAQTAGKHGVLVPWILVASQCRFDGVSASDNKPVLQGSLYWWRPDKTYAGVFLSQVDYRDPGETSYEVDVYAGRHFDVKGTQITLEAMYSFFPDNRTWGPTYDFLQTKVKARRTFEKVTLAGDISWSPQSPYGSGEAWRVEGEAAYALTPSSPSPASSAGAGSTRATTGPSGRSAARSRPSTRRSSCAMWARISAGRSAAT